MRKAPSNPHEKRVTAQEKGYLSVPLHTNSAPRNRISREGSQQGACKALRVSLRWPNLAASARREEVASRTISMTSKSISKSSTSPLLTAFARDAILGSTSTSCTTSCTSFVDKGARARTANTLLYFHLREKKQVRRKRDTGVFQPKILFQFYLS